MSTTESHSAYTPNDLHQMRGFSLQRKIQITTTRMIEWYRLFSNEVYIVFDGTPESRVLVELGKRLLTSGVIEGNPTLYLINVQTGSELLEMDEYITNEVAKLSKQAEVSIEYIEPEHKYLTIIEKYGFPVISKQVSACASAAQRGAAWAIRELTTGKYKQYRGILDSNIKVSPYCCEVLKTIPHKEYESRTGRAAILPTLVNDNESEEVWFSLGCNSIESHESRPLSFWTKNDVINYARAASIKLPDFPTGCARCMFGKSHDYYCELSTHIDWWRQCVIEPSIDRIFKAIGTKTNKEQHCD